MKKMEPKNIKTDVGLFVETWILGESNGARKNLIIMGPFS
jgi:hypothetical protein